MTSERGTPLPHWSPRPLPPTTPIDGRTVTLERLDSARHGPALYRALSAAEPSTWDFLPYGPFGDDRAFASWLEASAARSDPLFYAILDRATQQAAGVASLMRIDPANGVIEIGHIHFAPRLKRTALATEALYLLMARAFDELGYRRLEWKCNALNIASRRAAERLGFTYEGTFRQAAVVKGRNRDTAWYAMLDGEWPARKVALTAWLDPANFYDDGRERRKLGAGSWRPPA